MWRRLYETFTGRKGAVPEMEDFLRQRGRFFEGDELSKLPSRSAANPTSRDRIINPDEEGRARRAIEAARAPEGSITPFTSSENTLSLRQVGEPHINSVTAREERTFNIDDEHGRDHGVVNVSYDPATKNIEIVSMEARNLENGLSRENATVLLRDLQTVYPDAETISGLRITGTRAETRAGTRIPLPGKPNRGAPQIEAKPPPEQVLASADAKLQAITSEYNKATADYRAKKIGDAEYLVVRKRRDAALEGNGIKPIWRCVNSQQPRLARGNPPDAHSWRCAGDRRRPRATGRSGAVARGKRTAAGGRAV